MGDANSCSWRKVWRFFDAHFEEFLSVFFLASMVILLSAIVFFRFVLNRGLSFAVELERMAFVWFVYTGAAFAARERRHIRVVAQFMLLPERTRRYFRLLADIIWIFFNIIIIREGVRVVLSMIKYPYESPTLGISMAYAYTIVPLSFVLITIRVVQNMVYDVKELINYERSR